MNEQHTPEQQGQRVENAAEGQNEREKTELFLIEWARNPEAGAIAMMALAKAAQLPDAVVAIMPAVGSIVSLGIDAIARARMDQEQRSDKSALVRVVLDTLILDTAVFLVGPNLGEIGQNIIKPVAEGAGQGIGNAVGGAAEGVKTVVENHGSYVLEAVVKGTAVLAALGAAYVGGRGAWNSRYEVAKGMLGGVNGVLKFGRDAVVNSTRAVGEAAARKTGEVVGGVRDAAAQASEDFFNFLGSIEFRSPISFQPRVDVGRVRETSWVEDWEDGGNDTDLIDPSKISAEQLQVLLTKIQYDEQVKAQQQAAVDARKQRKN
jgi:hypothetical protein